MNTQNHGLILLLVGFLLVGCQPASVDSSRVAIRIPTKEEFQKTSKVSALAVIDYNLLCFAINVRGGSIPLKTPSCDVSKGIVAGSVGPGGDIVVDIPFGFAINFEVIGLLRSSISEACPPVNKDGWNWPIQKIYSLGETKDVRVDKPETTVVISVGMPDTAANLASQMNLPASCSPSTPAGAAGRLPFGAGVQTSTNYRAYSRVSYTTDTKTLSSPNFKIRQWKAEVQP